MTVTRTKLGTYVISDIVNGRLITYNFYFYTKKQAIKHFKELVKIVTSNLPGGGR